MKISADTGVCVASGQCALLLPQVFDQRDEDGVVVLLDERPPPALREAARQAVLGCPSGALRIDED
ncbi:ferredoxin [Dactylosporangium sp. NPDC000555]|uniref:ferredoxin n=1 Tax=Dactylosporangium sp. NPDC000555 TaxID=3154260 RepID=UPI00332CDCFB